MVPPGRYSMPFKVTRYLRYRVLNLTHSCHLCCSCSKFLNGEPKHVINIYNKRTMEARITVQACLTENLLQSILFAVKQKWPPRNTVDLNGTGQHRLSDTKRRFYSSCGIREKVQFFSRHFFQIKVHSHVTFPFASNINVKVQHCVTRKCQEWILNQFLTLDSNTNAMC